MIDEFARAEPEVTDHVYRAQKLFGKPMPEPKQRQTRLQFELSYDMLEEFERLRVQGGFETRKDLLNNALTLLSWTLRHVELGHIIAAIDDKAGKSYELRMPFLFYDATVAKDRSPSSFSETL